MTATARPRLLIPLYVHPAADPRAWRAVTRHAALVHAVVLNVADGPGGHADPVFADTAAGLRAAGVRLLGYADTGYGRRPLRAVLRDVLRHRAWYGVDGVFLDQVPADAAGVPRLRTLVRAVRLLGARCVVLNHGTHPDPGYARLADLLVTFEGGWDAYREAVVPEWTARHPPDRFCHLVYDVPPAARESAARIARARGAAVHCAVPGRGANPWSSLPVLFDDPAGEG
ncbi:spherulation-specific family 4 protein [Streptomyces sp. PTM05]|uniref:Spherulation-specific family 4 protein n=1 Tax=Streptantibioticus parmotrematis TaxID=2873249 RepID=A0ABS7QLY7_9ACTN|nr:spherulation-specific family 4 protein [Streptantibioticus parmotrematis]MBY8883395.1 spherulation-specific family 4 protein [Streptantibioticus parmotrematis]